MTAMSNEYLTGLSKSTFLLAFASLFADISTEMLYPVLPVFLTQTLQANGSIAGFIDGLAQATQNVVQGFSGALSDKLQKRKPIALAAISSRQLQSRSWVSRTLGKGCSRRAF
jgi:hypothetical protein